MNATAKINSIHEQIIIVGAHMAKAGLVTATLGNISARLADTTDRFVITPSGIPYQEITKQDLVVINGDGSIDPGQRKPSTELLLHKAVYEVCAHAGAIVHSHSIYASAFAVARQSIPAILEDQVQLVGGEIPTTQYAPAGSLAFVEAAAQTLLQSKGQAVLLANHGLIGIGDTVDQAYQVCQLVEKTAQIYIMSTLIGKPNMIPEENIITLKESYFNNYGQRRE